MGLTEGLEALNLLICTHHTARSDLYSQTTSETCLSINQKLKSKSHFLIFVKVTLIDSQINEMKFTDEQGQNLKLS